MLLLLTLAPLAALSIMEVTDFSRSDPRTYQRGGGHTCTAQHSKAQHIKAQHSTVKHSTLKHSTAQKSTVCTMCTLRCPKVYHVLCAHAVCTIFCVLLCVLYMRCVRCVHLEVPH